MTVRIRYIFILLFLLKKASVFSQTDNCQCSEFPDKNIFSSAYLQPADTYSLSHFSSILIRSTNIFCQIRGYELKSEIALQQQQNDSAYIYLNQATYLLQNYNCSNEIGLQFHRLWAIYHQQKFNYDESLKHCFKALAIAETQNDNKVKAYFFNKIATNFIRLQQYDKAKTYSYKAIALIQKITPSVEKGILLEEVASAYNIYHQVAFYENFIAKTAHISQDSALKLVPLSSFDHILDSVFLFANEAKTLAIQFNDKRTLQRAYRILQAVEFNHNNLHRALAYVDSSLALCVRGTNDNDLFMAYGDKADIYFKMKNAQLATQYADSCVFYAQKTGIPLSIANAYLTLADIAEMSGDWKTGFYALRKVKVIMDSVQNIDRTHVVNELEQKYNQAQNENTIRELAQEKRIYFLLMVVAVLTIVIFIFYSRQKSLKLSQKIMEAEQRLNRVRMNPHFFFNALTSLQVLALKENDGQKMASTLSKFSHIMRKTLESSYQEFVTIEQEIDFLNNYLELQKNRFAKSFNYKIIVADDLDTSDLLIPSMMLQPFAENAIEHGFVASDTEGVLQITFKEEDNNICIDIADNGMGLNHHLKTENEHTSRALQIMEDRIYLLNMKLKSNARFTINNQIIGQGVCVRIYLPIIARNESFNN
ncbi:MAG: histidine kinase [Saprospiraceae bacterium]|nr:histidine kinase [Saprospiraceae bacterium]